MRLSRIKSLIVMNLFFLVFVFAFFFGQTHLHAKALTPYPSKYFVHDSEAYFWDLFHRALDQDYISRWGALAQFTPWSYVADLYFEGGFGFLDRRYANMPLSQARQHTTIVNWMAGYMFHSHSDRHPDHAFPDNSQFLAQFPFAGLNVYSAHTTFRIGYLHGVYGLENNVWSDESSNFIPQPLNYPYQDWWYNHSRSVGKRLCSYGQHFDRLYVNAEGRFSWVLLKIMSSFGIESIDRPAYSLASTTFPFFKGRYALTPYYIHTNDVEGLNPFQVQQTGLEQRYLVGKARSSRDLQSYAKLNINYTKYSRDEPSDTLWERFYLEVEYVYQILAFNAWYNQISGPGVGAGFVFYIPQIGYELYIKGKYNPYASIPVYKRSVYEDGWSIEWGFIVNAHGLFGPLLW